MTCMTSAIWWTNTILYYCNSVCIEFNLNQFGSPIAFNLCKLFYKAIGSKINVAADFKRNEALQNIMTSIDFDDMYAW